MDQTYFILPLNDSITASEFRNKTRGNFWTLASDMAMQVTADMVQIFGGYGISKEHPVEKFYRDAKLLQIMDGTNEVVSLMAAEEL